MTEPSPYDFAELIEAGARSAQFTVFQPTNIGNVIGGRIESVSQTPEYVVDFTVPAPF
jgi:hypothetical protein